MTRRPSRASARAGLAARRAGAMAIGLASVGLLLASCSSSGGGTTTSSAGTSSSSSSTSSTSGGSATSTSTSSTGTGGGSETAARLNEFAKSAASGSKATFTATYKTTSSAGSNEVTIAQMPPKQVLKTSGSTGSAELLYDGKKTYYCGATGSGAPTCVTYSSKSGSPLGEILDVYTGAAGLKAVRSLQTQIGSGLGGYHVTFSSDSFAGEPSTCVTWTHASESAKYCVTKSGVLAYAGGASSGSTGSVELTSFSPTASASQFQLPAGAKVTNVP